MALGAKFQMFELTPMGRKNSKEKGTACSAYIYFVVSLLFLHIHFRVYPSIFDVASIFDLFIFNRK